MLGHYKVPPMHHIQCYPLYMHYLHMHVSWPIAALQIESDFVEVPIAQSTEDYVRLKGSRECDSAECAEEKRILREEVEMLKKMIRALVAEAPKKVVAHDQKRSGKKSKKTELQKLKHHIQKLESTLNWYKLNVTDILNVVTHQQDVRDHLLSSYKEEIEVKVAQVKQYQKQVEAYRAEVLYFGIQVIFLRYNLYLYDTVYMYMHTFNTLAKTFP